MKLCNMFMSSYNEKTGAENDTRVMNASVCVVDKTVAHIHTEHANFSQIFLMLPVFLMLTKQQKNKR